MRTGIGTRHRAVMASVGAALSLAVFVAGARPWARAPRSAADGLTVLSAPRGVDTTLTRLRAALDSAGLTVVAQVDHAAAARRVGLSLRPTVVVIAGNPRAGTPLMQRSPTMAIDLPLKFLVWEDGDGAHLAYDEPRWLAARHGVEGEDALLGRMAATVERVARWAVR